VSESSEAQGSSAAARTPSRRQWLKRLYDQARLEFAGKLTFPDKESQALFRAEDRRVTIRSIGFLCLIAVVLVPLAAELDYFAYPEFLKAFFPLRLLCAGLLIGILWSLPSPFAQNHHRTYTVIVPLIPASFISLMIYLAHDPGSPYYAGLTLCLVAIGFIFHWTYAEGFIATCIILGLYGLTTFPWISAEASASPVINSFTFIALNGVVIVCGSHFYHRIRVREFITRLKLDRSRLDLEGSNQQLRQLDQLKNDFLANVIHELRTPLTLLLAPMQSLRLQEDLSPPHGEMIETMHRQALRLLKLINDLLDIAKLESGQLELRFEMVSVREFVNSLVESIAELARQRNLTVTAHIGEGVTLIQADRDKLEKICLNLLLNAIKFTPEFGRIHLGVRLEGGNLVWTIKDIGIGTPAERLPMIFERFWQEDTSSKKKHPGTGFGLALVKELTETMGGSVLAESQPNQGTMVTARLPVRNPAAVRLHGDDVGPEPVRPTKLVQRLGVPLEDAETTDWLARLYREAEFSPGTTAAVDIRKKGVDSSDLVSVSSKSLLQDDEMHTIVIADDDPGMRTFLAGELM
jgi:signal transduction histidine kinase